MAPQKIEEKKIKHKEVSRRGGGVVELECFKLITKRREMTSTPACSHVNEAEPGSRVSFQVRA